MQFKKTHIAFQKKKKTHRIHIYVNKKGITQKIY